MSADLARLEDIDIRLADGRTALETHEAELKADRRYEWGLLGKEVISLCIVIAVIIIRQRWFV